MGSGGRLHLWGDVDLWGFLFFVYWGVLYIVLLELFI
jgi:hypothetical protein